jgi:hypothetical protein
VVAALPKELGTHFLAAAVFDTAVAVEASLLQEGRIGSAVPQASRRRKFLVLVGVQQSTVGGGALAGRALRAEMVVERADRLWASVCVDLVIEMFVGRDAKHLQGTNPARWLEVGLITISYRLGKLQLSDLPCGREL